jgi:hypothetical protein
MNWNFIDDVEPVDGELVLTVGYSKYGWTTPIPAVYKDGRFFMSLGFNSERVTEICIETFPTHWSVMPDNPILDDRVKRIIKSKLK